MSGLLQRNSGNSAPPQLIRLGEAVKPDPHTPVTEVIQHPRVAGELSRAVAVLCQNAHPANESSTPDSATDENCVFAI